MKSMTKPKGGRGKAEPKCRLAVDIGGTFTDVAIEWPGGRATAKVLTTPTQPEIGVLEGIDLALEKAGLAPGDIDLFIHGTTLATNALIERKGARTGLITTSGFRDVIEIGRESRFDQYDINLQKPAPLVPREWRWTLDGRVAVDGGVLQKMDLTQVDALVPGLEAERIESVAIAFLHSYANPSHEKQVAARLAKLLPRLWISISSDVCGEIREYERFMTTCANAYVQPIMASYLRRLDVDLRQHGLNCPLLLITSSGGLTTLQNACSYPIRLVESGPAGGAILAAWVAQKCDIDDLLSFDMGGTTAKICLIDQHVPTKSRSFEVARTKRFMKGSGLPIRIPVVEMVEIGAGGGSIAGIDTLQRIKVGPESATSVPGPACYGKGGVKPTVTDADLMLGKIDPLLFAAGRIPLSADAARKAIADEIAAPLDLDLTQGSFGVCEIVEENMANASRVHAIERGKDISKRAMLAFGGAAPLHAARLAEKLNIDTVVVPLNAGVGSAIGFLRARVSYEVVRSHVMRLSGFDAVIVNALFNEMIVEGTDVVTPAAAGSRLVVERSAFARYAGQGHEIEIALPDRPARASDRQQLISSFNTNYRQLFGRAIEHADIEILSWSTVVSAGDKRQPARETHRRARRYIPKPRGYRKVFDGKQGKFLNSPIYWRPDLRPGANIEGPAIITEEETSTVVTSSFSVTVSDDAYLFLRRKTQGKTAKPAV